MPNALGSDLVVVLGDYFATHRFITEHVTPPAWAAELAPPARSTRRYAILGNHDWWHRRRRRAQCAPQCRRALAAKRVCIRLAGPRFWLAGWTIRSRTASASRFRGEDDLPGTLARITTDDPVILLAHEPDIFVEVPTRVALTIAGHTHGGQISLAVWPPALGASA